MKKVIGVAFLAALMGIGGCTDATQAKIGAIGEAHRVILYSGGKQVASWETTGMVRNETDSDGFYFNEKETNALVRVTGDVVILMEADYQKCVQEDPLCQYQ